jgi:hypothetical protein
MKARISDLEQENKDLRSEVQNLAAEKQVIRLQLLQAQLENDKVQSFSRIVDFSCRIIPHSKMFP